MQEAYGSPRRSDTGDESYDDKRRGFHTVPSPSVHRFLREAQLDPRATGYAVTENVVQQLYRALWTAIFHHVSPAHVLPREIAPTAMHALIFLERCEWNLCNAQKRAAYEVNERRRERLGGVASARSTTASASTSGTSSPLTTSASAKGSFVLPRSATPPPGSTQADALGAAYGDNRKGMPCGHVFKRGEAIYRCRDCALDPTCVLCGPCFNASNHEGHDVVFSLGEGEGGCCDCGDEEAWTQRVLCRYHEASGNVTSGGEGSSNAGTGTAGEAGDVAMGEFVSLRQDARENSKGKAADRHTMSESYVEQVEQLLVNVPTNARNGLISQLSTMFAYILDTMEHAPKVRDLPRGDGIIEAVTSQPTLEPASPNHSDNTDDMGSFMPSAGAYRLAPPSRKMFSVVLWNDEKHSFKEVIDIVCEATGRTELAAKSVAERVDQHGREIIDTSTDVQQLYMLAHRLSQINLAVTIRPAYDIYAEEVAGHVLELLLDLANASFAEMSGASSTSTAFAHPHDNLVPSTVTMRALVGRAFLEKWQHCLPMTGGRMSVEFFDKRSLLQMDGMLLLDCRLWKSARRNSRALYIALIGPREVKRAVATRFACMFSKMVESDLLQDREPELSIRYLDVQLLTVPSIAADLVARYDLLHKMIQIMQAIFTGQLTEDGISLPPNLPVRMQAQASSMSLAAQQQPSYMILYDVRYLLASEGVQRQICAQPAHITYFTDFLALFNAILPNRRAVGEHVEFESDHWISVYQFTQSLVRTAQLFGEAYGKGDASDLLRGLSIATVRTLHSCEQLHTSEPEAHSPITFRDVTFAGHSSPVVAFAVESQGVSFYHPLHWLLADMLKFISKFDYDFLSRARKSSLAELLSAELGENGMLVLFDFPLRVIVKLAQIRAGLWVRNGFGIRSQAHQYCDSTVRDNMFDKDLFMLQCSLILIDPDRMLVTIVQRFSLLSWLSLAEKDQKSLTSFDVAHVRSLAEELILLLITLLSETAMAVNWSMDAQVRREIVHYLALNRGTYSQLTRPISERLKVHATFDRVLASVSKYRAPDGTSDVGIFELKDECFDEVHPFYFHYTRNQREKAEQVLRERQKRKSTASEAERYVYVPSKKLAAGQNVFLDGLRKVYASPILLQVVFGSLKNEEKTAGELRDGLVDGALQLLMMGLVEYEAEFAARIQAWDSPGESLIELLLSLRIDERFANVKMKLEWILERAAQLDPYGCGCTVERMWKMQVGKDVGSSHATVADEKRKAAARARQAAIMQQFSIEQKNWLDTLEDEDGEDGEGLDRDEVFDVKEQVAAFGSCIFCQDVLHNDQAFGSLALVQSSRVMRSTPRHDYYSLQQSLRTPLTLDRDGLNGKRVRGGVPPQSTDKPIGPIGSQRQWDGFPAEDRRFGFYTSTCGHLMHLECFDAYLHNIENRHAQQIARNHPEDLSRSEFICPLCKSLGNVILPVPKANPRALVPVTPDIAPISDWIRKINIDILRTSTNVLRIDLQETEHGTGCFVPWFADDANAVLETSLGRLGAGEESGMLSANRQILERLCRVLRPLSAKSRALRSAHQSRTILAPPSRKMYIPEELIAYTIAMLEIAQRGVTPARKDDLPPQSELRSPSVADAVNDQSADVVLALIACLRDIARLEDANYQAIFRHGLLMRLLPHWGGHDTVRSPLVLRDPVTVLVETAAVVPEYLHQVTILLFYVQLIQVVFGVAQPSLWPQSGSGGAARSMPAVRTPHLAGPAAGAGFDTHSISSSDAEALEDVFDDVRGTIANIIGLVGYARGNITLGVDNLDDISLAKMICTYCLPFLRRATILQRCMGILPRSPASVGPHEPAEFNRLMKLLGIPFPREALSASATRQSALAGLVEGWIKHAYPQLASIFRPLPIQPSPLSVSSAKAGGHHHHHYHHHHHPTLQLEHPHIYELIRLPVNLTTLLMQCQMLRCKRCGNAPPDPAICLDCGEVLCFQSFCCQDTVSGVGELNRHLDECGQATGLFYKIKHNLAIFLFQGKGCFAHTPYLDMHGEMDIGLRKGKIHFLHTTRFDELRKQWLHHGLPNMVARRTESVIDPGGWSSM